VAGQRLKRGSIFEGMRWNHAIVVIRRGNQHRRIFRVFLNVMQRRVRIENLELGRIVTLSVVRNPGRADGRGEPVESCKLRYFNSFEFFDHTRLKSSGRTPRDETRRGKLRMLLRNEK
jgi:hypothetical protein